MWYLPVPATVSPKISFVSSEFFTKYHRYVFYGYNSPANQKNMIFKNTHHPHTPYRI